MFGITDEVLDEMESVDVRTVDINTLTDIRDVKIDKSLPGDQRISDFVRQIQKKSWLFLWNRQIIFLYIVSVIMW